LPWPPHPAYAHAMLKPHAELNSSLLSIQAVTATDIPWAWDHRYKTAVQILLQEQVKSTQQAIALCFPNQWSSRSPKPLPTPICALINDLAGLEEGQTLYTRPLPGKHLFFAALWPWDDQSHVSLRVGLYSMSFRHGSFPPWHHTLVQEVLNIPC